MKKIFLVISQDGNLIKGEELKDLWFGDQVVYLEQIEDLVNFELEDNNHFDYIEDYDSDLEFYLSNVIKDSYFDNVLDTLTLTNDAKELIQEEVIRRIKYKLNK